MLPLTHSLAHSNLRMSRTSDALSTWYSHPSVAPVAESEQPQQRAPRPQHRQHLSTLSYAESEPADDGEHICNELDGSAEAHQTLGSVRSASDSQFPPAPVENLLDVGADPLPNAKLGAGSRRGSRISNRLQTPDLRIHLFGGGGSRENGMTNLHKLRKNSISESLRPEDVKIPHRKRTGSLVPQSTAAIVQFFKKPSSRQSSPEKTLITESSKEMRSCATQTLESAFTAVQVTQKHIACQTELNAECLQCPPLQPSDGGVNKAPDQQMVDSMCESLCSAKSEISSSPEPSNPTTAYPVFIVTASSGPPSPKPASPAPSTATVHQVTDPTPQPVQQHQQQSAFHTAQPAAPETTFSSRSESFSSSSSAGGRRSKSKSSTGRSHKPSHSRANSDCDPPIVLGMISMDFDVCLLHMIASYAFLRSALWSSTLSTFKWPLGEGV